MSKGEFLLVDIRFAYNWNGSQGKWQHFIRPMTKKPNVTYHLMGRHLPFDEAIQKKKPLSAIYNYSDGKFSWLIYQNAQKVSIVHHVSMIT